MAFVTPSVNGRMDYDWAMGEGGQVTALSRTEAASLLGWWLEAGVDVGISEEPRNWLTAKPLPLARAEEARSAEGVGVPHLPAQALPQVGGETSARASVPTTLLDYHAWLASSADLPLFRAGASRALPHGPGEPEVMLVTGLPSPEDASEGKPIGGVAWQLMTRMLAAIGLTPDQAYVAALSCFSEAFSRLSSNDEEHCREALLHHIALVAPKRLLLLGDEPARLLLGERLVQARGRVHRVQHLPTVVTFHPRHLLERSADKALAWRDLLLLMGEPT